MGLAYNSARGMEVNCSKWLIFMARKVLDDFEESPENTDAEPRSNATRRKNVDDMTDKFSFYKLLRFVVLSNIYVILVLVEVPFILYKII